MEDKVKTKKIAALLICAALSVSATACNEQPSTDAETENENEIETETEIKSDNVDEQTEISVEDIAKLITAECQFPTMYVLDADAVEGEFGIDSALLSEFYAAVPEQYPGIERIFIARVADQANVDAASEALNTVFETVKAEYIEYIPSEYEKTKGAEIITDGNFISLVICPDSKTANKIIKEAIK